MTGVPYVRSCVVPYEYDDCITTIEASSASMKHKRGESDRDVKVDVILKFTELGLYEA